MANEGYLGIAETILSYLDDTDLLKAQIVCRKWHEIILGADVILWRRLLQKKVSTFLVWTKLGIRRGWIKNDFLVSPQDKKEMGKTYREIFFSSHQDLKNLERNWKKAKFTTHEVELSMDEGIYCLQFDERKLLCGLQNYVIKMWDRKCCGKLPEHGDCVRVFEGHQGPVFCLK